MKLLWVKSDLLHPTTRGGQIRTLEMLRRLHARHEVHYVCLTYPGEPAEALARASEYCSFVYPVAHQPPDKRSFAFVLQLAGSLFAPLPVALGRFVSPAMRTLIAGLQQKHRFDCTVADFLFAAPNIPDLGSAVLFQHNVEAVIWQRRVETASDPVSKAYLRLQANRMFAYEKAACLGARKVVAVSETDAETMRRLYGVSNVPAVSTGVDVDFFAPPAERHPTFDLVFVGSMDWMPNTDGASWFTQEVLPLIRKKQPACSLAIVGRDPSPAVQALAKADPRITVTGTVPDVRSWMFDSSVAIVPLRIGGGTRLKIYEAMAAGLPVVSTTIGAEGLRVNNGENICIADSSADFAAACLRLLESPDERSRIAGAALHNVRTYCSWEAISRQFEDFLTS